MCVSWDLSRTYHSSLSQNWDLLPCPRLPPALGRVVYVRRTCVSTLPEFLSHVLYRHQDHVTAGHRGQTKTFQVLSRHFYWPGMRAFTTAYVESCVQCRASKSFNQNSGGLLQPLLLPSRRWKHFSLDFVTDLPLMACGNDAILVLVDTLSKMAHFLPTTKTVTAEATTELLADRRVCPSSYFRSGPAFPVGFVAVALSSVQHSRL